MNYEAWFVVSTVVALAYFWYKSVREAVREERNWNTRFFRSRLTMSAETHAPHSKYTADVLREIARQIGEDFPEK